MGLVLHELAADALLQVLVGLTSSMLALLLLTLGPRATLHPSGRGRILATGAASGAMTTALAMPGPAVLAVMLLEGRSGEDVRSTLLALFTASYAVALALHAITPGIASSTWRTAAWLAAPTLAGALAGRLLRHHLDPRLSRHIVLALLLTGGLAATAKGISG